MNSYIWSDLHKNSHLNTIENIALQMIIILASKSNDARNIMIRDNVFKQSLIKHYFYSNKTNKNIDKTILQIKSDTHIDTKHMISIIFNLLGYKINENISEDDIQTIIDKERGWVFDKILQFSNSYDDSKIRDVLIPINNGHISNDYRIHETSILWVPYYYNGNNTLESLQRHININIGDVVDVEKIDFTNLNNVTVVSSSETKSNPILGIMGVEYNEEIMKYTLAINIQLQPFEQLSGDTIILNMLKSIDNNYDFFKLNDIFTELWLLLGSDISNVVNLVSNNLNMSSLSNIINGTNEYMIYDSVKYDNKNHEINNNKHHINDLQHNNFINYYINKLGLNKYYVIMLDYLSNISFKSYFNKFINYFTIYKQSSLDSNENVTEIVSRQIDINNTYTSFINPKNDITSCKKLQTNVLGMLTELVYLNTDFIFKEIRDHTNLINSIKSLSSSYPNLLKYDDIPNDQLDDYTSILDNRREYKNIATNVVNNAGFNTQNLNHIDNDFDDPDINQILSNSWTRQRYCKNDDLGPIYNSNKLLNIVGHHNQTRFKNRGLKILSIDGGGSKGVIALEILHIISNMVKKPIHRIFDIICGTSTGGLLASLLALEKIDIPSIQKLYQLLISRIFTKDSYHITGARLLMSHALYDINSYYTILKSTLDRFELVDYSVDPECPKFFCISAQMDTYPLRPILWRNYNYPPDVYNNHMTSLKLNKGSCIIKLSDAIRATTAATGYFPPFERNGHIYADGALHSNNPSLIALLEAKLIYPNTPIECLVSIGNGISNNIQIKDKELNHLNNILSSNVISHNIDHGINDQSTESTSKNQLSLEQIISQLINAATDTETIHTALGFLLPYNSYFRFNPIIPNVRIDETDKDVLEKLKNTTKEYLKNADIEKKLNALKLII